MNAYAFRLQKVLDWRRTELELEEARYRHRTVALATVERELAALAASAVHTESEVRSWNPISDTDLAALGEYRLHLRSREAALAARRTESLKQVALQQTRMLEARRRYRLLERLKERGVSAWTAERDRELELLASESFLAHWGR